MTNSQPIIARAPVVRLRAQKEARRAEAEARKAIAKVRREYEKHLHELEMRIATFEGQQKELLAELEDPAAYEPGGRAVTINRELSAVSSELARLNAEWDEASEALLPTLTTKGKRCWQTPSHKDRTSGTP